MISWKCSSIHYVNGFFSQTSRISLKSVNCSVISNSLRLCGLYFARHFCPWNSLDKNPRVGSHSLLQEIFLTQRSNLGLLHCLLILHCMRHQGSPVEIVCIINFPLSGITSTVALNSISAIALWVIHFSFYPFLFNLLSHIFMISFACWLILMTFVYLPSKSSYTRLTDVYIYIYLFI